MKLSILIPARGEEWAIESLINEITRTLLHEKIRHEIIVVYDAGRDNTGTIVRKLQRRNRRIRLIVRKGPPGFGLAIRDGLDAITGDAVVIVTADASDSPGDIVAYYRKLEEGYDCVFGSRFIPGAEVKGYPAGKMFFNRTGSFFIKHMFGIKYNDVSNSFKAYRRHVIESIKPLVSGHFNISVEIPLKAIVRGFNYAIIPIQWHGRTSGESKYLLGQSLKKYLITILYVWLEKKLLTE